MKFDYTQLQSGIIQRGEEIFPQWTEKIPLDPNKMISMIQNIPLDGERLMTYEEVLGLYD